MHLIQSYDHLQKLKRVEVGWVGWDAWLTRKSSEIAPNAPEVSCGKCGIPGFRSDRRASVYRTDLLPDVGYSGNYRETFWEIRGAVF